MSNQEAYAIDMWLGYVMNNEDVGDFPALLSKEVPPLISWIVRGGCAVQCQHCIFPVEGPKARGGYIADDVLIRLLGQLPRGAHLVHEGRQLLPQQIPVLASIARAGYSVSLINNGQYATKTMLANCESEGLQIDALDVSIDGPEQIHNIQRSSGNAWRIAVKGIEHAREVLKPTGKLTSLFTLTSLNYAHVRETGEKALQMVDEWHVTTMSLRPGIEHLRAGEHELASALEQMLALRTDKPVYLRSYSLQDFVSLLALIGKDTAHKALAKARVTYNAIVLDIGIPLYFYPKSLQVNETIVIDADGEWRLPFCIHYSLAELQAGRDTRDNDISHFNVGTVSPSMDVSTMYPAAVSQWWASIGETCLLQERGALAMYS